MTDTLVTCPQCGSQFPLSEALTAQLHAGLEAEHEARLKAAVAEAQARAEHTVSAQIETLNRLLESEGEKARQAKARKIESLKKLRTPTVESTRITDHRLPDRAHVVIRRTQILADEF